MKYSVGPLFLKEDRKYQYDDIEHAILPSLPRLIQKNLNISSHVFISGGMVVSAWLKEHHNIHSEIGYNQPPMDIDVYICLDRTIVDENHKLKTTPSLNFEQFSADLKEEILEAHQYTWKVTPWQFAVDTHIVSQFQIDNLVENAVSPEELYIPNAISVFKMTGTAMGNRGYPEVPLVFNFIVSLIEPGTTAMQALEDIHKTFDLDLCQVGILPDGQLAVSGVAALAVKYKQIYASSWDKPIAFTPKGLARLIKYARRYADFEVNVGSFFSTTPDELEDFVKSLGSDVVELRGDNPTVLEITEA